MGVVQPAIAPSAGKHGVSDEAMLHAFNNPIRVEELDEGLVMLVGPDHAGNLFEIGVVVSDDGPVIVHAMQARPQVPKVMPMPRTVAEILDQADELAARFEAHEPDADAIVDATALRTVRRAFQARADAERQLADAVSVARAEGHSWAAIGAMVGTSGEAARQRYGRPVER